MSDIKLDNNNVILEGNVGIGTNGPRRQLHVEGNEIHSGGSGAGFSFSDRNKSELINNPSNGERWIWYAQNGQSRLWSGNDKLSILPSGNVGIGTNNPIRKLHVEGSEIHSGGSASGFSFDDRTKGNGERWVWYAQEGSAHLFCQKTGRNSLSINNEGDLFVDTDLFVSGTFRGEAQIGVLKLIGREMGPKKIVAIQCEASALQLAPNVSDSNARFALLHELSSSQNKDQLIINYENGYKQGIKLEGNVQTTGALAQASSITLKENVSELSGQEAMAALQGLNAVKYNYKADEQKEQRIGFIAEDVPDLVANSERDRLSPMDLIAVLTKAVQEQQIAITSLMAQVSQLKQK
jgi:hypothetical protein